MKHIEADKSFLDTGLGLGLSCIENYLLYIYANLNIDYRYLFSKSYVGFSEIAKAFCENKVSYSNFNRIPRLQDTSAQSGILNISENSDFQAINTDDSYICIGVSRQFIQQQYNRDMWRDDHFVLLCNKTGDVYKILNDNPQDIFVLTGNQLENAYNGTVLNIQIIQYEVPYDFKLKYKEEFVDSLGNSADRYLFKAPDLETARDLVGVLRVTRKRIREYCSLYCDTNFMSDYISQIEKVYFMIEYMRIRGRVDHEKVCHSLSALHDIDINIIGEINGKMRVYK